MTGTSKETSGFGDIIIVAFRLLKQPVVVRLVVLMMIGLVQVADAQLYGDFYISNNGDGTCEVNGYAGGYGAMRIPQSINGLTVTSIANYAFYQDFRPTSVTMGSGVTNIGNMAFYYCYNLKNVTVGSGVISLGDGAFATCLTLTNVTIPSGVITIGDYAFSACNLRNLTIPNTVTTIGNYAFEYNEPTSVTIPDSVTSVGNGAFLGCSRLTNVTISASVANLGTNTFNCINLRQAYFRGDAPLVNGGAGSADSTVFQYAGPGTVYYLPGTTGWGETFGGWPTAQLYQPQPQILGSSFGLSPQGYGFGFTISGATNTAVVVEASTNLQIWTPVITNALVNGTNAFVDLTWTNYPQQFYRIRSL